MFLFIKIILYILVSFVASLVTVFIGYVLINLITFNTNWINDLEYDGIDIVHISLILCVITWFIVFIHNL